MAKKRMFSHDIIENDVFLDMPATSQLLYMHLNMYADDDGFVSPKRIMRMINANDDDLKILIAKRYVLWFESGVVVIKHWHLNNTVRKDRSAPTTFKLEFESLTKNEFGAYTEKTRITATVEAIAVDSATIDIEVTEVDNQRLPNGLPNDNQRLPQIRLEEIRLDKTSNEVGKPTSIGRKKLEPVSKEEIDAMYELFSQVVGIDPGDDAGNRKAAAALIRQHGKDKLSQLISGVALALDDQYAPRIGDFKSLKSKQVNLIIWGRKKGTNGAPARF
jgi:hypothetical protein